jgi:transposase
MVVPRHHELTDEEWALLEPLLPPQHGTAGPLIIIAGC